MNRNTMVCLVSAGALVLGACGGSDEPSEALIEELIENAAQQDGEDIQVDVDFDDDGNFSIQTEDGDFSIQSDGEGNVSIQGESEDGDFSINADDGETVIESDDGTATISQGADLPDNFPGSVPLPQGFVPQYTQAMSMDDGDSWVVGGAIEGDAAAIADAYIAQLAAAGFAQQMVTQAPGTVIFGFDDGEYAVNGAFATDPADAFLNLTVAPSQL